MGTIKPIVIPITGELNTLHPAETNEAGSLQDAIDVDHHSWAARPKRETQTQPLELTTGIIPGPARTLMYFGGDTTWASGEFACSEQRDLGTAWNLSIWFDLYGLQNTTTIPIFRWIFSATLDAITIGLYGNTYGVVADRGKMYAIITSTTSAGVASTVVTLKSPSVIPTGNTLTDRHVLRISRDGPYVEMELDGVMLDRTTTFSSTEKHVGTDETGASPHKGFWNLAAEPLPGDPADIRFKGYIYLVVMRNGAWTYGRKGIQAPAYSLEHQHPRAKDIILYLIPEALTLVASHSYFIPDYSKYGSHGYSFNVDTVAARDDNYPYTKKGQGLATFTDAKGVTYNAVLSGGVLCYNRVL